MPIATVLLVLLSIGALLLYVLPVAKSRLSNYAEDRAIAQAFAAANAVASSDESDLQSKLGLAANTEEGEVLVVDQQGKIVAQAGQSLLSPSEDLLQRAANGERINEMIGGQRVVAAPLLNGDNIEGGVIFAPGESENALYELFLRSGIEAAAIAAVLGGGLALLLATLLSRRVERLALGARAVGGGDLSSRIEPGFNDELGELAESLNSMAQELESSFIQLEEKNETLDAVLNNLTEGVLATDLKGNVMFTNHSARVMLGLDGQGTVGKLPSPFEDFDLPGAVAHCAKENECGEARVQEGESSFHVKLERMSAFDEHKGGVLVVIQDLSEGRRLEANQQRFLANAAHELKTPITTILGASELLLNNGEDPETRRRFLNHIFSEARRLQRLSDTLLRLARTGADFRDPEREVVDLDGVAREAAERIKPLAESAGLALRVEGQGDRVRADQEWLEQALLVTLSNAVRHSEHGGEVRLRVEGGAVTVEDEGTGISEADLPHVFERFYRGKKQSPGGFGLGLAICKELVERMGGGISLESEEGVGTKVKIELAEVDSDEQDTDS